MAAQEKECTLTLDDGTHYDLSSLASAKADYETVLRSKDNITTSTYKLNVCRGVVSEVWKLEDPETVAGFVSREQGDFSLGRVNTTLHISPLTNEPMLYLQNGSPCPTNEDEQASTAIRFICSKADFDAGKPLLVAALPPLDSGESCHFFFEWRTHVACPTNVKAELESHHLIAFGAILLVAILTWFGGHTLYNRFYLAKRGLDQFPIPKLSASSFKLHLPESDPADPSQPRWGFIRRSQRGYTAMRSSAQEEEEGLAGARYSLTDDDEEEEEDLSGGNEDARVLGGEAHAWRGQRGPRDGAHVHGSGANVHRGLVDI